MTAMTNNDIAERLEALRQFAASAEQQRPHDKQAQALNHFAQRACDAANGVEPNVLSEIWGFHAQFARMAAIMDGGLDKNTPHADRVMAEGEAKNMRVSTIKSLAESLEKHQGQKQVVPEFMPYQYRK